MAYRVLFERCERVLFSRSSLITAVGSGILKQTAVFVRFPFLAERNEEKARRRERASEREGERRRKEIFLLSRQYAPNRCNCYFDWRIRPKIQPIMVRDKKEKFH